MSRKRRHRHHDWSVLLRDVVAASDAPVEKRPVYLAFARELLSTLRRKPIPDFTRRTKMVVWKWFKRGLSGHVMWQIEAHLLDILFGRGWARQ
jgi:hypothetical protein